MECLDTFERFFHARLPTLIKAALAHVQFETIHPVWDKQRVLSLADRQGKDNAVSFS
jgi:hypothetical protein